jgi:N-acetyl-D-muramate 6-phosphate phosphatase
MPFPHAVLFDLDGTLADTAHDLGAAANAVRVKHQLAPLDLESYRPYASHGAKRLVKFALSIDDDHPELESNAAYFLDYYSQNLCHHTTWFEGIPELIKDLQDAHIPWGIVTNKHSRFGEPLLQQIQPLLHAGCLIYGDTTAQPKPHPEPLLEAARRLSCAPQTCWYIGDAERDIVAARQAGMQAVVAGYGYIGQEDQPDTWGSHHFCPSVKHLHHLLRAAR